MIAARYYRDALMLSQARSGRPHTNSTTDYTNEFGTLTHDFADGENPGLPPTVPAPGDTGGTPPPTPTPSPSVTPTTSPTPTPTITPSLTPTPTPTAVPSPTPGTNLALNKPVTCSTEQVGNEAPHAVDGDLATRWSADIYPEWIQVDLGATYSVNRMEVARIPIGPTGTRWRSPPTAPAYTQVVDRTNNTTGASVITDTFTAADARYVKLTVTGAYGYTGTWSASTSSGSSAPAAA